MAGFWDGVPDSELMAHFDAFSSSPGVAETATHRSSLGPWWRLTKQVAGTQPGDVKIAIENGHRNSGFTHEK